MSGLDPVGRKEVRDLIVEEKAQGRTVFFSSHILSDVETLCDRLCILRKGQVVIAGALRDLLTEDKRLTEVVVADVAGALRETLAPLAIAMRDVGGALVMEVEGDAGVRAVVEAAFAAGATLRSIAPKREKLEDFFVREVL